MEELIITRMVELIAVHCLDIDSILAGLDVDLDISDRGLSEAFGELDDETLVTLFEEVVRHSAR